MYPVFEGLAVAAAASLIPLLFVALFLILNYH